MNEFELIGHLRKLFHTRPPSDVVIPNGDDCGVFSGYAVTMDSLIEHVHFERQWLSGPDIGYKAVAVNLSDLAAMGAKPYVFMMEMGVPAHEKQSFVLAVARGMAEYADTGHCYLIGGNITGSPAGLSITITMIGHAGPRPVRRNGARPGDEILVSGFPGRAETGRMVLQQGMDAGIFPHSVNRFRRPVARLDLGQYLGNLPGVNAGIDISDGLLSDLGHICEASNTGAILDIDRLPIHSEVSKYAHMKGEDPVSIALTGGEEYELIITAEPDAAKRIASNTDMVAIGRVVPEAGIKATKAGKVFDLPRKTGWQHF